MKYVAGFMFDVGGDRVALVRKNKPAWQKGHLNAIGGKIEGEESPYDAMVREFEEETGVTTLHSQWALFCTLTGVGWTVYFFHTTGNLNSVRTVEEEQILVVDIYEDLPNMAKIDNLGWLIPMALAEGSVEAFVRDFTPGLDEREGMNYGITSMREAVE